MISHSDDKKELVVLCQRKSNGDIYVYHSDNTWENLKSGLRGKIEDEKVKNLLVGKLVLTEMANKNPLIIELLKIKDSKGDSLLTLE